MDEYECRYFWGIEPKKKIEIYHLWEEMPVMNLKSGDIIIGPTGQKLKFIAST